MTTSGGDLSRWRHPKITVHERKATRWLGLVNGWEVVARSERLVGRKREEVVRWSRRKPTRKLRNEVREEAMQKALLRASATVNAKAELRRTQRRIVRRIRRRLWRRVKPNRLKSTTVRTRIDQGTGKVSSTTTRR
ncbi:MAG: hypothetical protein ACPGNP_10995 [Acidimicrobiales bacterium]